MMKKDLSPAEFVFKQFGGYKAVADLLGAGHTTVWHWKNLTDKQGNTGCVPAKWMRELLDLAEARGIKLTHKNLICGGPK